MGGLGRAFFKAILGVLGHLRAGLGCGQPANLEALCRNSNGQIARHFQYNTIFVSILLLAVALLHYSLLSVVTCKFVVTRI